MDDIQKLAEEMSKRIIEAQNAEASKGSAFKIGQAYYIRTATYHLTGRVVEVSGLFLILEEAAWIADSGRFMSAMQGRGFDEVEPFGDTVLVNTGMITDAQVWNHPLPREQHPK